MDQEQNSGYGLGMELKTWDKYKMNHDMTRGSVALTKLEHGFNKFTYIQDKYIR